MTDDQAREAGITYAAVREALNDHATGEISFGRLIERLREMAIIAADKMTDLREERAAAVAFLRGDPDWPSCKACRDAQLYAYANAIQRGAHRAKENK